MSSPKKVTRVKGAEEAIAPKTFVPTPESKAKAGQLRLFAIIAWILAMGGQAFAILKLINNDTLVYLIIAIVLILALAITASLLWKKANRLDPASEKDKIKFFIQNQLGAILGVLAFLPLVIFIFTNKNIDSKTKGIAGIIATVALLIAGITGVDFNPPSIEQYTQQSYEVEKLTGQNLVYWTKSGSRYHLTSECHSINTNKTEEIFEGSVAQARELKNITELCDHCRNRKLKETNLKEEDLVLPAETEEVK